MLSFVQTPGRAVLTCDGDPILTAINEHVFFRSFVLENLKCRPGGPVELVGLLPTAFFGSRLLSCEMAAKTNGPHEVQLDLTPAKVDGDLAKLVREERRLTVNYLPERQRFRWTITAVATFLQDITGDEGLHHTPMPQWGTDDFAVIEYDDPLLHGGFGPQVPMTQDWVGLPEPGFGPDAFTTRWRRRYLAVIFETVERSWRRLMFNRVANGVSRFYNRTLPRCTARQPYYYEKTDGRYLRLTPLFDHCTSHHICEWGYDMHQYAMLPKAGGKLLFARGQRVELPYELEEVEATEVPAMVRGAANATLEPAERDRADRPIYEEPVCRFTASTLENPDCYSWEPSDGTCAWSRTGGARPGCGALEIWHGARPQASAWTFGHFGPSNGGNPIPPRSRFRLTARIRADELARVRLSLTLRNYQGPALFAPAVAMTSTGGWVDSRVGQSRALQAGPDANGWATFDFVSDPAGPYVLCGEISFAYDGSGSAALSEVAVVRL